MYFFFSVNRGFGFITFADPASVDKVLAQGNHELDGKKVSMRAFLLQIRISINIIKFLAFSPQSLIPSNSG